MLVNTNVEKHTQHVMKKEQPNKKMKKRSTASLN